MAALPIATHICLIGAGVALWYGSSKAAAALLGLAGILGLLPLVVR